MRTRPWLWLLGGAAVLCFFTLRRRTPPRLNPDEDPTPAWITAEAMSSAPMD